MYCGLQTVFLYSLRTAQDIVELAVLDLAYFAVPMGANDGQYSAQLLVSYADCLF